MLLALPALLVATVPAARARGAAREAVPLWKRHAWPGPVRRLARISYERWLTAHRLTGLFA